MTHVYALTEDLLLTLNCLAKRHGAHDLSWALPDLLSGCGPTNNFRRISSCELKSVSFGHPMMLLSRQASKAPWHNLLITPRNRNCVQSKAREKGGLTQAHLVADENTTAAAAQTGRPLAGRASGSRPASWAASHTALSHLAVHGLPAQDALSLIAEQ